ncbi:hypothetical protein P9112_003220 [Eukaryota sp. TZLM1-RC]
MPGLDYFPEAMPLNAHPIILINIHPNVTLGALIENVHIFHLIPLPTHMVPFSWEKNRHLTHRYRHWINQLYLNDEPASMYYPSLWRRAEQCGYRFHDLAPPPCNPRECSNIPKCGDHFPWTSDMLTVSSYDEQLYDFRLNPTALTYSELKSPLDYSAQVNCQPLPDPIYANYILSPSRDVTIHLINHYGNDESIPCPVAVPGVELVYGHQIDPSDRQLLYNLEPLEYPSIAEQPSFCPDPEFLHDDSSVTDQLTRSWASVISAFKNTTTPTPPKYSPQVNDRVFVLYEKPDKVHGHYVGPYTIQEVLSSNSVLLFNPVTRSKLKTSTHLIKPSYSSL